jgi:hypothetical protein
MDAFKRLSNKSPWIPFRAPDSTSPATVVDNEEARLFDEMATEYKRSTRGNPAPAHKNYHVFAKRWNEMVANKFKEWCNGDEDIILPYLKSCLQLQDYYDKRQRYRSLQSVLGGGEDTDRDRLRDVFRNNRNLLPQPPTPQTVTPPQYVPQPNGITPFGHPTALNAAIAMGIVNGATQVLAGNRTLHVPYRLGLPNLPVGSVGVTRVPEDLGPGLGSRNRVGDPRPITRD